MSIESTELATNKGGAPLGNQNAKKGKLWTDALRKAIAQNPHKLRLAAEKLLDDASEGNIMAIKEIGDRMDGKAVQATTFEDGEGNNVTTSLEVRFHAPLITPSVDE